jgi:2-polyprenyl-3-methyl-5-hydroxy-6-metoxy-1,4-benzoquinol methylase
MENLEKIAMDYHLSAKMPDMFIEAICQEFEISWLSHYICDDDKVLDLGFGDGLFLQAFKDHPDFTILEGSKSLVKHAKSVVQELHSTAKIVHTYFEEYVTTEKYDVVIASHVLEHVNDPKRVLNLCKQWLSDDGEIIVIVPNRESLHRRLGVAMELQRELDDLSARDKAVGHLRVYSLESLTKEIEETGFKVLEKRGFFTKALSNAQMINLDPEVFRGLCKLSSELPAEMGANIGLVCKNAK